MALLYWSQEWGLLPVCHVQTCHEGPRTCDTSRMQILVHRVLSIEVTVANYHRISKSVSSFNYLHPFQVSKVTPPPGQIHTTRKAKVFSTKNSWFFRSHFEMMAATTDYHSDTFSGIPKETVRLSRKYTKAPPVSSVVNEIIISRKLYRETIRINKRIRFRWVHIAKY